jgi:hypothetical protein
MIGVGLLMLFANVALPCELDRLKYMIDVVGNFYTVTAHDCGQTFEITVTSGGTTYLTLYDIPPNMIDEAFKRLEKALPQTALGWKPYTRAKFIALAH